MTAARPTWRDAALVGLLAVAVHTGALHGTHLVYDDHGLAAEAMLRLESPRDALHVLTRPYQTGAHSAERLWRPFPVLALAVERSVFEAGPDGHRRVTVGLHALAAVALLHLLARFLPRSAAVLGAALFAVHAVHAEATSAVSGRLEVMAGLGVVLMAVLHLRGRAGDPRWFVGAAACWALALASKESALAAPGWLLLLDLGRDADASPRRWRWLLPHIGYAVVLLLYLAARAVVLGELTPTRGAQVLHGVPLAERALIAARLTSDAFAALAWPRSTSAQFPVPPADGAAAVSALVHAGVLALALASVRARCRWRRGLALGASGVYVLALPGLNLVPIGVVRADRLLYVPSLAACFLAVALLAPALRRGRLHRAAIAAILLLPHALQLAQNVRAWTDDGRLWAASLRRFPDEPRVLLGAGQTLLSQERWREALPLLELASRRFPPDAPLQASCRYHLALACGQQAMSATSAVEREQALAAAQAHAEAAAALAPHHAGARDLVARLAALRRER